MKSSQQHLSLSCYLTVGRHRLGRLQGKDYIASRLYSRLEAPVRLTHKSPGSVTPDCPQLLLVSTEPHTDQVLRDYSIVVLQPFTAFEAVDRQVFSCRKASVSVNS